MPAATPQPTRLLIWQAAQQGQSTAAIALGLGVPVRTVYHLLRQFRAAEKPCAPRFQNSGRRRCPASDGLCQRVLQLRRQHPLWGAQRILSHLFPAGRVPGRPGPSTVRRWLVQAGLAPAPRPRPTVSVAPLAQSVHDVWPMDAAECKPLRDGRHKVCWLRLLDEASGAALFSVVYDQPRWAAVGGPAVQAALRRAFSRWGRPGALRVDNGQPWVSADGSLPSDLELWLAGLGVALHRGRPRVPEDNPRIERSQRTARCWAEPWAHDTAEQLQRRMDEEDHIHREVYLFDDKQTRLQAYPGLAFGGQPYSAGPGWEAVCWDHQQALGLLGRLELARKVDSYGCVSLYDHKVAVSFGLRGQEVRVGFDPTSQEWVFSQEGQQVRRSHAANLGAEEVRGLKVRRQRAGRPGGLAYQRRVTPAGAAVGNPTAKAGPLPGPAEE